MLNELMDYVFNNFKLDRRMYMSSANNGTNGDDMMVIVIIAVALMVVIALSVLVLSAFISGKNTKEDYRIQRYSSNKINDSYGAGETTILRNVSAETEILREDESQNFEESTEQMPAILMRTKNNEMISINKEKFVLGKERRKVDYCITNNNSISREHANIIFKDGNYYLVDLNSTNSTYLNGQQIEPYVEVLLSKNDKIKLANETFVFR